MGISQRTGLLANREQPEQPGMQTQEGQRERNTTFLGQGNPRQDLECLILSIFSEELESSISAVEIGRRRAVAHILRSMPWQGFYT